MPTLPAYVATHRADASRLTFRLVKLHFAVPQCLTDCEIPVVHNGDTYLPAAGLVVGATQESRDQRALGASIQIGNGSDYWGTLLASLASADRHPAVQVFEAWLDQSGPTCTPLAVRGLLAGAVESAEWGLLSATLTVGAGVDAKAATLPWRAIETRCTYRRFKGPQCAYAGATATCDRSYATCAALGNQARFGGFRTLPSAYPVEIFMQTGAYPSEAGVTITLNKEV